MYESTQHNTTHIIKQYSIVETPNGNKILTKEEFVTLNLDGKIKTTYGVRQKQGGGEMKDYNDITYTLVD